MVQDGLSRAFHRLGRRYPLIVLGVQFQLAHVVALAGVGLLTLYQSMSSTDFWRLLLAIELLILIENIGSGISLARILRPATAWLDGRRDDESTIAAWRALVDMPVEMTRRRWLPALLFTMVPWCIYATFELGLPAYSAFILFGGGLVTLAYAVSLRFLGMELAMRPVLREIARALPDGARLGRAGVPLRWKLLAGLPVINVITGVIVAGLSTSSSSQLSDLGVDVLIAMAVAFTISLELTVLLSRSILAPIDDIRDATLRVGAGDLTARVPILSTDEIGSLSRAFNTAVAGLEERERLREAFGVFIDPDVAERVLREGTVLEGEEVEVSVLFLDIRGFTAFAERASARQVVAHLNEFYDLVVPALLRHGGHTDKFVGDGLLGVFGAPDRLPDHADRAVAAAIDIVESVRSHYGGSVRVGVGVSSGPVVAGTIGGGGRLEFTVIGDTVNTAARVEGVTRETGEALLITEATRCLLTRDCGGFEERDEVLLKGKSARVRLWAPCVTVRSEDGPLPAAAELDYQ